MREVCKCEFVRRHKAKWYVEMAHEPWFTTCRYYAEDLLVAAVVRERGSARYFLWD